MKKKELKKRIKDLQQLTDCLISDNVRLLMRLGDMPCCTETKERFNYDDVPIPKFNFKTEGPESESELKENEISLEVGKKYLTKNGYALICKFIDENNILKHKYVLTHEDGSGYMCYSQEGVICIDNRDWDIVSEVKE